MIPTRKLKLAFKVVLYGNGDDGNTAEMESGVAGGSGRDGNKYRGTPAGSAIILLELQPEAEAAANRAPLASSPGLKMAEGNESALARHLAVAV